MSVEQTVVSAPRPTRRTGVRGLSLAVASAAAFGLSGGLGSSLMAIGWTPPAVVTVRLGLAALVLLPVAAYTLRGQWRKLARKWPVVLTYGLLAAAGCQVCYFYAVQRLGVALAMLLEYTAPILLVLGHWVATKVRPSALTVCGSLLAMTGLTIVLDVFGGFRLDPLGVLLGFGAAVGLSGFFVISARIDDDVPPLGLATGGLALAALALGSLGTVGVLPMHANLGQVTLAGHRMSWLVPVVAIALISGAVAYLTGIWASQALGPKVASFVGLLEVVLAVVGAHVLVGEQLGAPQLIGGVVILVGVAAIKYDEARAGSGYPAS